MWPAGTFSEAELRGKFLAKNNPGWRKDNWKGAGGSKSGIELESWQCKPPPEALHIGCIRTRGMGSSPLDPDPEHCSVPPIWQDPSHSHPPQVPVPKNYIDSIPRSHQYKAEGPLAKGGMHPAHWQYSIASPEQPYQPNTMV